MNDRVKTELKGNYPVPILSRDRGSTCLTAADKPSFAVIKPHECTGRSFEYGLQAWTFGLSLKRRHPLTQIFKSQAAEFHISAHLHKPLSQKQRRGLPGAASLSLLRRMLLEIFST